MTCTKPTARHWGEAIRRERTDQGLSLLEVAKRTGIDPGHLSRAERGLAGIGDEYRAAIARALGKPPDHFTDEKTTCPSADSAEVRGSSPTPATPADRRSGALSAEVPDASGRAANRGSEVA